MIPHPVNPAVIVSATQTTAVSHARPVTAVRPVPDATQSETPAFVPGQKYTARVEEGLRNGQSAVSVAGRLLHMRLPASVNSGTHLALTFISESPRLKFLLHQDTTGSSPATLSTIGKFIVQLLSQPAQTAARSPDSAAPLLPTPPATRAMNVQLSGQLQQALTYSGLFYEAHLAQWLSGSRSLQQLRREPQGKLSAHTPVTDTLPSSPISTQLLPLVHQQLHTLETGLMQWHGEIWPGQSMEWEITNHSQEHREGETADIPLHWQSRIRLQLPNLGEITTLLLIDPHGIRIKLDTRTDSSKQRLRQAQSELATAMHTAGLTVQAMEVWQHDES